MCDNLTVAVERDVRSRPSSEPLGASSEVIEPVSRPAAFDFSKGTMIGTMPADNTNATPVDAATPGAKSKPPQTIREFERALKSLGYSQRESTAIAKGGFKSLGNEPEPDLSALKAALAKNTLFFESKNHD